MASTYSNLKIQLMATGENSGTWGNVTNTNLGTALEQAITGSVDVTVNSDTTLSLTDTNAAQNARALRLNLTGSGAANLTVPAIQKLYLINNATLGTVTVKNATGATIAVPTTKTMWVFSTGTGVVDAVTHLSSLTLGSALPIASGGTGSTSTTYANLQTNVTGTLPIANGGTGSTTATFSGANITSLNASAISTGTLSNDRTTATASNGASTIVARDASGNFTGATITATTFSGSGASLTSLNASSISTGTVGTARLASGTANSSTYLRGDQTWATVTSLPGAQGQVFTSSGTFTIPTGITAIKVTTQGGGGGGGGANHGNCGNQGTGGNGGGGGCAIKFLTSLTPGNTLAVTVGGGGNSNAAGGNSTVASGTQSITTIQGTGGSGGNSGNDTTGTSGAGGGTSGGDASMPGSAFDRPWAPIGGASVFGRGGRGLVNYSGNTNGQAGTAYGGGGSGAQANGPGSGSGGAGGAGVVIIEW